MSTAVLQASPDVQLIDVHLLAPWERNPRTITDERYLALKKTVAHDPSMLRARPIIALVGVDYASDGSVVGGNMRQRAALELVDEGNESFLAEYPDGLVPTYLVTLTEAKAKEWALRDNNPYGAWDDPAVAQILAELRDLDIDLELTGFPDVDMTGFFDQLDDEVLAPGEPLNPDAPIDPLEPDERGTSLAISDVSISDPSREVERGDVWELGPHLLVCASVYEAWPEWAPLLTEGMLFVPYPTPTVPLSTRAKKHPLLLVQPDPWLAGHVLDKYAAVEGADTVRKR